MGHDLIERRAKARKRLVRMISQAVLGPMVGKMPKSSIESLEKASYYRNIQRHIADVLPMTDACIVKHEVDPSFPLFFRREAVFAKRNLYVLSDAVVSPHSGMAWIENRILEESVGSLRRIMDWGDVLHEPLMPVRELQLGEPVVVCHPANYYHWLFEVLPSLLHVISRFPQVKIVVPEHCPKYVTDGLAAVLGPEAPGHLIHCQNPVRVETLLMPQYHSTPEFTHPQVLNLLREGVKKKAVGEGISGAGRCATGGRIYISRRKGGKRRLAGEELLEERLREAGFAVLHCEELSFGDQIRIFNEADTVVATHGAGLSNLVWSEAPCRVIEIFPNNYILDCFAWLSFSLGFDYRYVICSTGHQIDKHDMDAVMALL